MWFLFRLRIGKLNVQGLAYKLAGALALAANFQIDILCLQETNLIHAAVISAQSAARKAGYNLLSSTLLYDVAGHGTAGVVVLSKWPAEIFEQAESLSTGRWI